jgi:hypothetical protein
MTSCWRPTFLAEKPPPSVEEAMGELVHEQVCLPKMVTMGQWGVSPVLMGGYYVMAAVQRNSAVVYLK